MGPLHNFEFKIKNIFYLLGMCIIYSPPSESQAWRELKASHVDLGVI